MRNTAPKPDSPTIAKFKRLLALTKSDNLDEARNAALAACRMINDKKLFIMEFGPEPLAGNKPAVKKPIITSEPANYEHMRMQFESILGKDHPEIRAAAERERKREK
jgi:hypothetical protein